MTGRVLPTTAPSGMKHTGVDNYNLCDIINACAKGGVSELKFGNVEVRFYPHQTQDDTRLAAANVPVTRFDVSALQDSEPTTRFRNSSEDSSLLDELRQTQLMIEDPVGFEREIIDSHLRGDAYGTVQN